MHFFPSDDYVRYRYTCGSLWYWSIAWGWTTDPTLATLVSEYSAVREYIGEATIASTNRLNCLAHNKLMFTSRNQI